MTCGPLKQRLTETHPSLAYRSVLARSLPSETLVQRAGRAQVVEQRFCNIEVLLQRLLQTHLTGRALLDYDFQIMKVPAGLSRVRTHYTFASAYEF